MRGLLGVLGDGGVALAPQPDTADLPELVAAVTASGLPVAFTSTGRQQQNGNPASGTCAKARSVRPDQGGIDIENQWPVGVGIMIGRVVAGQMPHPCPGRRPSSVDRLQRGVNVAGQDVDCARHRRIGGDPAIDTRFGTQQRNVGQQSPPKANVSARSSTTLDGSWTAAGLRHRPSDTDNPASRPLTRTVSVSSTPPA